MRRRKRGAPPACARARRARRGAAARRRARRRRERLLALARELIGEPPQEERAGCLTDPPQLIPAELAERAGRARAARGGDFAELYARTATASRCRSTTAASSAPRAGAERGAACAWWPATRPTSATSTGSPSPTSSGSPTRSRPRCAARRTSRAPLRALEPPRAARRSSIRPEEVPAERKAELLRECDERARGAGAEVAQVAAAYAEARRQVQVANSDGLLAGDDRTRVRLGAQVVARRGDRVETGAETLGGHAGFELLDGDPARGRRRGRAPGADAARRAARRRPAGCRSWSATASAACCSTRRPGHGLEADAVQKERDRLRRAARRAARRARS